MIDLSITEAMFNRYSEEKQREMLLELFSKIRDKGYFYEFGLTVYAREQKEKANVIAVDFRQTPGAGRAGNPRPPLSKS